MATSSKRAYVTPSLRYLKPLPLQQAMLTLTSTEGTQRQAMLTLTSTEDTQRQAMLTHTSTGDTQRQIWLSICGVSGSSCARGIFEPCKCLWQVWG